MEAHFSSLTNLPKCFYPTFFAGNTLFPYAFLCVAADSTGVDFTREREKEKGNGTMPAAGVRRERATAGWG